MSGRGIATAVNHKVRFLTVVCIVLMALSLAPAGALAECAVHGSVYHWATFTAVSNAVVTVYSVPDMSLQGNVVVRDGSYNFSLPAGEYMIVATSGTQGSSDAVTATENITVPSSGDRVIDLILFPASSVDDLSGFVEATATPTLAPTETPTATASPTAAPAGDDWSVLGIVAIVLAIIAIVVGLMLLRMLRPKKTAETEPAPETTITAPAVQPSPGPVTPVEPEKPAVQPPLQEIPAPAPQAPSVRDLLLPEDCRQVLAIIEKNDGRITQLDLRKMLPYSEAKVSLIVSDLENRGLVKKIKKGRGNVLILNRPDERPPDK